MRIHHFIVSLFLFVFALAFSGAVFSAQSDQQEARLKSLKGEISQLSSKIDEDKKSRKTLINELARSERQIGRLGQNIHQLQVSIEKLDQELNDLDRQKSQQQRALDFHRQKLRALMQSAYVTGRQERLKLFLNQQDPVLMNRILTYYDFFNEERIAQIEVGKQLISQIQQTEEKINLKKRTLDDSYLEKNQQLESLHQARQTRSALVAKLDADILDKSATLQQLKDNAAALQQILVDLQRQEKIRQQNRSKPFKQLKGRLPWPSKGYLSKFFGSPKAGGVNWDGVFISAPEGKQVAAIHYGQVVYSDWLRGYGLLMIIDHGDGFMSLYGHNQSLFKEVGESIDAGEPIALIGKSGGQKNAGLYFSIRKDGKPTNPKKWCKKLKGRKL